MGSPSSSPPLTPMLRQYQDIKAKYPHCILFFRLGDFYEMFYDDATVASRALDLVLTSRGKGTANQVPMCGIPYHSSANYIARLIKSGHKVAICEQVEDPALAKGIVRRDVIRVITSGTYLDDNSSESRAILALAPQKTAVGIAFTDPNSGTIRTRQCPNEPVKIAETIAMHSVTECVYPEDQEDYVKHLFTLPSLKTRKITLSPYQDWSFNPDIASKSLCAHFGLHNLAGFGIDQLPAATAGAGALLDYLKEMNKQPLKHIDRISLETDNAYAYISPAAMNGLEIDNLIKSLNHTQTAMGSRLFRAWFTHPLKFREDILKRQDAVKCLIEHPAIREDLKKHLNRIPDLEKTISRLSCGLTHARDLLAVRNTLALIPDIQNTIQPLVSRSNLFQIDDIKDLRVYLTETIAEDIPLSKPEGKVIREGIDAVLDELRSLQENGRDWLKNYQAKEIQRTGINTLKVGFNKVFGYYIEISKGQAGKAPDGYIRKQTLVNAERYITDELKQYEEKILSAEDKIREIENRIIQEARKKILDASLPLHHLCDQVARIDGLFAFSQVGSRDKYIFPDVTDGTELYITGGRHPVVERSLVESFVPNDTRLDCGDQHLVILTGPNMAGKSTYIRQTAVLTIMAQTGCPIPASSATIGIVDKIFTRIGAHDDIAKGQSTFMVEMNETADILNNLTERSLVILDEIGRGTSTYDGLSLAWALAEHLARTQTRTLFATHFHELTALAGEFPGVKNYNVAVKEWKDTIVFLHKIVEGGSDDSYGIYVAKLAGIPDTVIKRAKHILTSLELKNNIKDGLTGKAGHEDQISFFNPPANHAFDDLREELERIDINNTTPLDALTFLQELKTKLKNRDNKCQK